MRPTDRGLSLPEVLVALLLVGIVVLMAGTMVAWTEKTERRVERRAVGLDLASLLMERIRAEPYASLKSGKLDVSKVSAAAQLEQPAATLDVTEDRWLGLKRVVVTVAWSGTDPGRVTLESAVGSVEIYQ